jgi:hypothetical protein
MINRVKNGKYYKQYAGKHIADFSFQLVYKIHEVLNTFPVSEYSVRTGLQTRLAAGTIFRIPDDDVFVPQETDLTDYLFRTGIDTFPTGYALTRVYPYMRRMDSFQSVNASFHLVLLLKLRCKVTVKQGSRKWTMAGKCWTIWRDKLRNKGVRPIRHRSCIAGWFRE